MQDIWKILLPIVITHAAVGVGIIIVIKKLLLGDTMQAINRIKQVEAEVRKKEESIRKEIEDNEKEFARKRADAESELQKRKEDSEKEVAKLREQVLTDAKKEGDRIIDQAKKNEEKFRKQISQDMEEKAVEYGIEAFKMVLSEKVSEEMNRHFINELLDALQEVDSSVITVDANAAEFVSSHPIAADQKARLEKMLTEKFGANIKVNEKINKDMIAGLAFKLGSLEIDGTIASRLKEAAGEIKKSVIM
ncbi:MAG: hypothetical protein C0404_07490 [Verrucomicrobia bacterium]|nr:hypothetical protein [Verrucomicrobiota bacterium]